MQIYLLRHGIAEEAQEGQPDEQRALTRRGRRRVELIAMALRRLRVVPSVVVSSPLVRARQTAEIVAAGLGLAGRVEESALLVPTAPPATTAAWIHDNQFERLLLVGHEPHLSALAAQLCSCEQGRLLLKKGALCRIDLQGGAQGQLVWLLQPRILRALGTMA